MNNNIYNDGSDDELIEVNDFRLEEAEKDLVVMKVPEFLYDYWFRTPRNKNEPLGNMRLYTPSEEQDEDGTYLELPTGNYRLPPHYTISTNTINVNPPYIFREGRDPTTASLVGKVAHEIVASAMDGPEYSRIIREQGATARNQGTIQVLQPSELPFAQPLTSNDKFDAFGSMSKASKTGADGKATRMNQSELHQVLFKLFQEYDYWNLKGLLESTHQPVSYLKEVLSQLCIFHRSGTFMHNYELKQEYKSMASKENNLPHKAPGGSAPSTSGQNEGSDYDEASDNILEDNFDDLEGDDDDDDMDDVVFDQVN